jgi:capsule polysaccharide export protein KpsE/RkpR
MKSVGSLEKELSVLKDKLTYLKQQPNTPAINAEITNLQTTITQKQQQINRFKATTK